MKREYLSADVEDRFVLAQANAPLNDYKEYVRAGVYLRGTIPALFSPRTIILIIWMLPPAHRSLVIRRHWIPFLEHDDVIIPGLNGSKYAGPSRPGCCARMYQGYQAGMGV